MVRLPKESFGRCKRYRPKVAKNKKQLCTSKGIPCMLADGLCEHCWDRMVSNKSPDMGRKNDDINPRAQKDIVSLEDAYPSIFRNQG